MSAERAERSYWRGREGAAVEVEGADGDRPTVRLHLANPARVHSHRMSRSEFGQMIREMGLRRVPAPE